MSEADERFPVGPRGAKGERGERGLSWLVGRSIAVLFLIGAVVGSGNLYVTVHEIGVNNQKFCAVVNATTAVPVAKPADPGANPSRETSYEWYLRFAALGRSLGCQEKR